MKSIEWPKNKTPVSHEQWRKAEDAAAMRMMQVNCLREQLCDVKRATSAFIGSCILADGSLIAPDIAGIEKLREVLRMADRSLSNLDY